jgi:hypothetical protein
MQAYQVKLFIFISFVVLSCDRAKANINPPDSSAKPQVNTFPHQIGDSWTYLVYTKLEMNDEVYAGVPDTVQVAIIGNGIYHGDSVKIWQFNGTVLGKHNHSELWVTYQSKEVHFFEPVKPTNTTYEASSPWLQLYFPLKVGYINLSPNDGLLTKITDTITTRVKAGNFIGCYEILKTGGRFNCYMGNKFFFKENMGFVKFTIGVGDMCTSWANGRWELLSYKLK